MTADDVEFSTIVGGHRPPLQCGCTLRVRLYVQSPEGEGAVMVMVFQLHLPLRVYAILWDVSEWI